MIFSGDEMICTLSCPNKLFYLPSLIKKTYGPRRPGQWYSQARPMVLKGPAHGAQTNDL